MNTHMQQDYGTTCLQHLSATAPINVTHAHIEVTEPIATVYWSHWSTWPVFRYNVCILAHEAQKHTYIIMKVFE